MRLVIVVGSIGLLATALVHGGTASGQQAKPSAVDPKDWSAVVDKAVAYLRSSQAEDGSWSKQTNPGITANVVSALIRSGKVTREDPAIAKAMKYIETMIDPETGSIAGKGGKARLQNYLTSVNLAAMLHVDPKGYAAVSEKAQKFLRTLPQDESRGHEKKDAVYGGVGYDGSTRPDLSNTVFFLEALRAAKIPTSDPIYAKILVFVSRSQNLKGEHNDQAWAGKLNDGSFVYGAGPAGAKKGSDPDAARPGYGSITCSGFVALDDCGVKQDDIRSRKALDWIQKEYSMEKNPGTPDGDRGFYLYLFKLAEVLDRAKLDTVIDGQNKSRDWRADILATLKARQNEKGSWVNKSPAWMEGNSDLATAWALWALSYCKPTGK